jgi:hypothetical protein
MEGNTFMANNAAFVLGGTCIAANSFFGNVGLGIDLGADGATPNDPGDTDTAPNNLQNYPVLTSAGANSSGTRIAGTLSSTRGATFVLEFFSNPSPHRARISSRPSGR